MELTSLQAKTSVQKGLSEKGVTMTIQQQIVSEIKAIMLRHAIELVTHLFAVVDDHLFKLSGQSGNTGLESDHFQAMRSIRRESHSLKTQFEHRLQKSFDAFWLLAPDSAPDRKSVLGHARDDGGLSLVDDDTLEEELAVSSIIEKAKSLFQRELYALDQRIAYLSGRTAIETDDNPIGPHVFCHAFAQVLKPLSLTLSIRILIYKLFEQIILRDLSAFYPEANASLIRAGIRPDASWAMKRRTVPPVSAASAKDTVVSSEEQQIYTETFEKMQNLLNGWRTRIGLPTACPDHFTGTFVPVPHVVEALGTLQHNIQTIQNTEGYHLKTDLQQTIQMQQPGSSGQALSRREEDVIDMVSMLFDFILEDAHIPDPVKGVIARLQIPVVKIAILERSFFGRKNHPVRLLLNALAQAGLLVEVDEGLRENPIFKHIEMTVRKIQEEFEQDGTLFSTLLDEFTLFMEKESQRIRIAEERTLQATQSKERVRLCKREVAFEIAQRLQGKEVPLYVRSFLFNVWKDVLVLVHLRRDRSPKDWEQSLLVMEKLIWSLSTPVTSTTYERLAQIMAPLLKAVKVGLEAISLDPQTMTEILKELQICQDIRLSSAITGGSESKVPQTLQEHGRIEIRDPELAQAIVEIRDTLPDIENICLQDLLTITPDASHSKTAISQETITQVTALSAGQWLEFYENKKRVCLKLSWKSQVTSTHVFVNRKGIKVMECSFDELVERFAQNRAKTIEENALPLIDRALEALMKTLQGSGTPLHETVPTPAGV